MNIYNAFTKFFLPSSVCIYMLRTKKYTFSKWYKHIIIIRIPNYKQSINQSNPGTQSRRIGGDPMRRDFDSIYKFSCQVLSFVNREPDRMNGIYICHRMHVRRVCISVARQEDLQSPHTHVFAYQILLSHMCVCVFWRALMVCAWSCVKKDTSID